MQEINLLDNKLKDNSQVWQKRNQLLSTIFILVLILELGLMAAFFLLSKGLDNKIQDVITSNNNIQADINRSQENLSSAKGFQAQLKNVRTILDSHVYWSGFFEEVSNFTLKNLSYANFQGEINGKIHLEGVTESYTQLGKLILGLNSSDKFDEIKLLSVNPATGETSGYVFSIDLTASKELFIEQK